MPVGVEAEDRQEPWQREDLQETESSTVRNRVWVGCLRNRTGPGNPKFGDGPCGDPRKLGA